MDIVIGFLSNFISNFLTWFLTKFIINRRVETFPQRENAKHAMFNIIKKSVKMVFIGISQTSLCEYLEEAIRSAQAGCKALPVEEVEVFFANKIIGEKFEGINFGRNIQKAVIDISVLFTDQGNRNCLPNFKKISFYQDAFKAFYGGSLFQLDGNRDFTISFVVNYFPSVNTRHSYTIKLEKRKNILGWYKNSNEIFQRYFDNYNLIKREGRLCYTAFSNNIWDLSVPEWDRFEGSYSIYQEVMGKLVEFGEVKDDHCVLDLGCGTGRVSEILANILTKGSLTLLDNSPQMIKKAREFLQNYNNVDYILADARTPLYGATEDKKFDRIVSHFSFHHFIDNNCPIPTFATIWKDYLKKDGEILLAIHNSFIETDPPNGYANWEDPFRKELYDTARKMNLQIKNGSIRKFKKEEIIDGFEAGGFVLKASKSEIFRRTMADRILMWHVPSVLNSVLDVTKLSKEDKEDLIKTVSEKVRNESTMPTKVFFFRFGLK